MHRLTQHAAITCLAFFAIQGYYVSAQYRYYGNAQAYQAAYMQQLAFQRQVAFAQQFAYMQQVAYYQQAQANQIAYMQQIAYYQGQMVQAQAAYAQRWAFNQPQLSPGFVQETASSHTTYYVPVSSKKSVGSPRKERQKQSFEQKALVEENERLRKDAQATKEKALAEENDRLKKELQAAKEKVLTDEIDRLRKEAQATKEKILLDENERLKKELQASKEKSLRDENERLQKQIQEQSKSIAPGSDSPDAIVIPVKTGTHLLIMLATYLGATMLLGVVIMVVCLRWKEISAFVQNIC